MSLVPTGVVPLLVFGYLAWRIVVRVRRNVGRQKFQRKRLIARIIIYSLMSIGLAALALLRPKVLGGLAGGLVAGIPLALMALRLTRFETTAEGRFFTPNPLFGIGVSLLFVGRLIYRGVVLYMSAQEMSAQHLHKPPMVLQSPLTLFLFGILAGYYIAYYSGILGRSRAWPSGLISTAAPPALPAPPAAMKLVAEAKNGN